MTAKSTRAAHGATLLEILVLVGLFLVLAAAVTPRFATAGETAMRDALRRQVEQVNVAIEAFRTDHDDAPPLLGSEQQFGWRPLVSEGYLADAPINALLKTALVVRSEANPALMGADATTAKARVGWFYSDVRARVVANGFDHLSGSFFNEPGYDPKSFAW